MAVYDPELGVYFEGGRKAYPITGVELHPKGLTIITSGGVRDDIVRWSVVERDGTKMTDKGVVLSEGNKTPLFYPERCQIIVECPQAHKLWQQMIGEAVTSSQQMASLPKSLRESAMALTHIVPTLAPA